jgi:hypothetical protein
MSLKGLPVVKCLKCGKTSLKDQYEISGCPNCHTTEFAVDFGKYRRRESLIDLGPGFHRFIATFKKVGNVYYRNQSYYAHVEDVMTRDGQFITNHTYVAEISAGSIKVLKSTPINTPITFSARVHCYNRKENKWGMDKMHDVVVPTI